MKTVTVKLVNLDTDKLRSFLRYKNGDVNAYWSGGVVTHRHNGWISLDLDQYEGNFLLDILQEIYEQSVSQ